MSVAQNHRSDWKQALFKGWTWRWLIGPAALLVVVALFYWKLVLTNQYTWLESPDLAIQIVPWFQFQAGEWHHFRFPMWDPNSWFGQPLFGQVQPGAAYPLNWLLFLVPFKNGWIRQGALHWYFVLIHYLAALNCYWLCRDLRRSRPASILAGCVYALGGYVAYTDWPQMVNGAVWTPLVFLFLFRAERGERPWRSALLSGFFLGFGWLAGHHQMNLFVSIAVAGLWAWFALRTGRLDFSMARLAACSLLLAVFASAFQTLPAAEYGPRAVRWTGLPEPQYFTEKIPYNIHEQFALKPIALLGILVPGMEDNSNPYVGIAAFSLGLLGAILAWRERQVRWLAMVGLGGILFALGGNSLFHGIFYSLVPLIEKSRVPGAGTLLFAMGVAPLTAFAVDSLPLPASFEWSRKAGWVLGLTGTVLTLASLLFFAAKVPLRITDDRLMITALSAFFAAGLFAAWRAGGISPRAGAFAAIALVLFELSNVTNYYLPNRGVAAQNPYLHRMSEHADLAAFLRDRGEAYRFEYNGDDIGYNIGDWYGLESFNASLVSVTSNIWQLDLFSFRAKQFFGIRYYLGKTPQGAVQTEVFQSKSGVKVFENPGVYPRVWSVHSVSAIDDPKLARPAFNDPKFDPLHAAFVVGTKPAGLDSCGASNDDVQMPIHAPNYVRIEADLGCPGMVILSDTWFPGWRATVDGKSAPIERAYGAVRGVIAPGGKHIVEMRYRPWTVLVGGGMSLLAAAVAAIALCV